MADTMFPDISVMRYGVDVWRVPSGWFVLVKAYTEEDLMVAVAKQAFAIAATELKQDDLLHVWEVIYREIVASTP